MNILIAGGGIGGLCAALCLQKSGHTVVVLERAMELTEVGAGLQCGANALRVMDYLRLLPELEALAVTPEAAEFCDYRSGDVFYRSDLGQAYRQRYGAPYLHILRADLLQVLADNVEAVAQIELGVEVQSFQEDEHAVTVTAKDGRSFTGDLLVGADGIKSVIRTQLCGNAPARFTRNVAWRGVVPVGALPQNFMQKIVRNYVGPKRHFVMYYLRQQQLLNFVGVVENAHWQSESWVTVAPWEELQADFAGWHPQVQQVVEAVAKDQCFRWALYDHRPLSNWSSNRVTLLGDAAHATLPFLASGAALAIEDARVLQRALEQCDDVAMALQLYQNNRQPRSAKIQQSSRSIGKLYHISNRFAQQLAFKASEPIAKQKEQFLASYDANSVELT